MTGEGGKDKIDKDRQINVRVYIYIEKERGRDREERTVLADGTFSGCRKNAPSLAYPANTRAIAIVEMNKSGKSSSRPSRESGGRGRNTGRRGTRVSELRLGGRSGISTAPARVRVRSATISVNF